MATGKHRKIHKVKHTEKVVPFITGEITFGQDVCELVFGVNIFDLDFLGTKLILSNIQSSADSVGSGHVSHRRTSVFNDHLDHCFIVFKNVRHGFEVRRFCVCGNVIHMGKLINFLVLDFSTLDC